jgi:hypothetical protein
LRKEIWNSVGKRRVEGRQMAMGNIFLRAGIVDVHYVSAHLLYSIWKLICKFGSRVLFSEKGYVKISQYFLWQEIWKRARPQNDFSWFSCHFAGCLSLYRNGFKQNKNPIQPNCYKHIAHTSLLRTNCFCPSRVARQ